jgi:hypothetical protein
MRPTDVGKGAGGTLWYRVGGGASVRTCQEDEVLWDHVSDGQRRADGAQRVELRVVKPARVVGEVELAEHQPAKTRDVAARACEQCYDCGAERAHGFDREASVGRAWMRRCTLSRRRPP